MPKQNFNEKLIALLKTNPYFIDESGELLSAAVKDYAWKLEHDLIKLLLTDPEIKQHSLKKLTNIGFSTITLLLTTSQPRTSSPTPTPNSVTESV